MMEMPPHMNLNVKPVPSHPVLTLAVAWLFVFSAVLVALWVWF